MRFNRISSLTLWGVLACGFAAPAALAQVNLNNFEAERLHFNPDGQGSLVNFLGILLPEGELRISADMMYEPNILLTNDMGGGTKLTLRKRTTAEFGLAIGVHDRVELGGTFSVFGSQIGSYAAPTVTGQELLENGVGTAVLSVKGAIFSERLNNAFNLALGIDFGLPVGTQWALGIDPTFWFAPQLALSKTLGPLTIGVNGTLFMQKVWVIVPNNPVDYADKEVRGSGTVKFDLLPNVFAIEVDGRASHQLTFGRNNVEGLAGLRWNISPGFEFYSMGGLGLGTIPGTPDYRVFAGVAFSPTVHAPSVAATGQPAPTIPVETPASVCSPGHVHSPAECPDLDDDGDGIPNKLDMCPAVPEDKDGFQDEDGCPDPDNDGDGVPDTVDRCPNNPGPASNQGCPVTAAPIPPVEHPQPTVTPPSPKAGILDSDNDGIPDAQDNCPTLSGPASNQGCPVRMHQFVTITDNKLETSLPVLFKGNSGALNPKSALLLNNVADVIKSHPQMTKVYVDGFTDNKGPAAKNTKLSQVRANVVMQYLVHRGVDPLRLEASGFGPQCPTAASGSRAARAANNRIEFNLNADQRCKVATEEAPAPEETAAPSHKRREKKPTKRRLMVVPQKPAPGGLKIQIHRHKG